MIYDIPKLPLSIELETKPILKRLATARSALAELKGVSASIPNMTILVNTLSLQEAKDSSEVENIVTTHDELYKAELKLTKEKSLAAKEVQNYVAALKKGFDLIRTHGLLTNNIILEIHKELEQNDAGYRSVPGTELKNDRTQEVVYTPPQHKDDIIRLMDNLVNYINDEELEDIDPLIKMAVIHHQFESIHPFYDGNGRTGRIINILYLLAKGLQDYPILYLSRYINQHKSTYYRLLQEVRTKGIWEEWILFILDGVEKVSSQSILLIKEIKIVMQEYKNHIRSRYPFYSQDLLNNLFRHPYTKIEFLKYDLQCNRKTASSYLNQLAEDEKNILTKLKMGRHNYYVNTKLVDLLTSYDFIVREEVR